MYFSLMNGDEPASDAPDFGGKPLVYFGLVNGDEPAADVPEFEVKPLMVALAWWLKLLVLMWRKPVTNAARERVRRVDWGQACSVVRRASRTE
jgi:hypothetical protein